MLADPVVEIHQKIRVAERALARALARRDEVMAASCGDFLRDASKVELAVHPRSHQGAAVRLRAAAAIAGGSIDRRNDEFAPKVMQIARRLWRGRLEERDVAQLRALLPAARRIDHEIGAPLAAYLTGVLRWADSPDARVADAGRDSARLPRGVTISSLDDRS